MGGRAALRDLTKVKEYIDEETYQYLYGRLSKAHWIIRDICDQVRGVQLSRISARAFFAAKEDQKGGR